VLEYPRFQGYLDFKNCVKRTKKTPFPVASRKIFIQSYENLPVVSKTGMNSASTCIFKAGLAASLTTKNRKDPELQQKL